MIEEESFVHETSRSFVINMELRENILFEGPHSRMELLRDKIGQYNRWQDQL